MRFKPRQRYLHLYVLIQEMLILNEVLSTNLHNYFTIRSYKYEEIIIYSIKNLTPDNFNVDSPNNYNDDCIYNQWDNRALYKGESNDGKIIG